MMRLTTKISMHRFDIDISKCIVSVGSISISFDVLSCPIFVLGVDFISLDSNAGNKEFSYDRDQIH